jgi:colanic acid/amylovoran biosynthesis glycosyltransferase
VFTVAYLANRFPVAVEPYVGAEIQELRRQGVRVIPCTARRPPSSSDCEILSLQPVRIWRLIQAIGFGVWQWGIISDLLRRAIGDGRESPKRRLKALLHTWLGAYYAVCLRGRGVDHIHVHHGYFGSWIAMVAARLLGISFSLTLHGSDLLLHGAYLDTKLKNCRFCLTISEYNRDHILRHFPEVAPQKIMVSRMGVDLAERSKSPPRNTRGEIRPFAMLAVGRLHGVKDHAFLLRACAGLRDRGCDFQCGIAGDGPERRRLELLIQELGLQGRVTLLGHIPSERLDSWYRSADLVVLTSRSEGIPLVLMEAMARGRIALAPAITGIPELVVSGKTGFLYAPGDLDDFIDKFLFIQRVMHNERTDAISPLDWIRHAARVQVLHNFDGSKNLTQFGDRFLQRIKNNSAGQDWSSPHENLVLQQI